jgi:hypothetical protein
MCEGLVLPLPEDLWEGHGGDPTLQTYGVTLGNAGVLQLLHEGWGLVHLFGCRNIKSSMLMRFHDNIMKYLSICTM